MVDQQYLDLLKQGVVAWNQWKQRHLDVKPDLSEAPPDQDWLVALRSVQDVLAALPSSPRSCDVAP